MTETNGTLVVENGERSPGPLVARQRSVDEARGEIKKRLWFIPVWLLIVTTIGFLLGDWAYTAIMVGLLGYGVVRLVGELKEPQRYLQLTPNQLADRILESRGFWETRGKELRAPEELMQVQDLLDGLSLQGSWLRRNRPRISKWTGVLATAIWLVSAIIMFVAGDGVLGSLVPLAAASLFAAGTVWTDRAESKRQEALELLQGAGNPSLKDGSDT